MIVFGGRVFFVGARNVGTNSVRPPLVEVEPLTSIRERKNDFLLALITFLFPRDTKCSALKMRVLLSALTL